MAEEIKLVPFPQCTSVCRLLEEFGVCECESFCPDKFDKNGNPKKENKNGTEI